MARLFLDQEPLTQYKDRKFMGSLEAGAYTRSHITTT
jgi:hypothetical protein